MGWMMTMGPIMRPSRKPAIVIHRDRSRIAARQVNSLNKQVAEPAPADSPLYEFALVLEYRTGDLRFAWSFLQA